MKNSEEKAGRAALRTCAFTFSLLLLVALLVVLPVAHADSGPYVIPLLGGRWAIYTIGVKIPAEPTWAHDVVIDAMKIWNEAQEWFAKSYFPKASVYRFVESKAGKVQVQFVDIVQFGKDIVCTTCTGLAKIWDSQGVVIRAEVQLLVSPSTHSAFGPLVIRSLALHELGHVLGLDHVSWGFEDLMSLGLETIRNLLPVLSQVTPSTLDLYAIHMIAQGSLPPTVSLPLGIAVTIYRYEVMLSVIAPSNISVTIDNVSHLGSFQAFLPIGRHEISVSTYLQLGPGIMKVFYGWKNGTDLVGILDWTRPQAALILMTNLYLEAIYDTKYLLKVKYSSDSDYITKWYDSNVNATFSVSSSVLPVHGIIGFLGGKQVFLGWYEAGRIITASADGTIKMDGPHVVETKWGIDYTQPLTLGIGLIVAVAIACFLVYRATRKS